MSIWQGPIRKLAGTLGDTVNYRLPVGDSLLDLNPLIGTPLTLRYSGDIHCIACGRKTSKSFNQGYCFPCLRSLARCDQCIVKPEQCHFHEGTCREPQWAEANCMQPHVVYLANTSGVKVGITRFSQVPTRWIDQGATQALPVFTVKHRWLSGLVEVILKRHVADKTDWRRMLKSRPDPVDLGAARDRLLERCGEDLAGLTARFGADAITPVAETAAVDIDYPVTRYPDTVRALNFDKTRQISGVLDGIKGQYLLLDSGVVNIRKFGGYTLTVEPH